MACVVATQQYANVVGPWKRQFIGVKAAALGTDGKPLDVDGDGVVSEADGVSVKNSNLVVDAKAASLFIHPYTMRSDVNMTRDYAGGGTGVAGVRNVAASFATAGYANEGVAFYAAPANATGVCSTDTVKGGRTGVLRAKVE